MEITFSNLGRLHLFVILKLVCVFRQEEEGLEAAVQLKGILLSKEKEKTERGIISVCFPLETRQRKWLGRGHALYAVSDGCHCKIYC